MHWAILISICFAAAAAFSGPLAAREHRSREVTREFQVNTRAHRIGKRGYSIRPAFRYPALNEIKPAG